MSVPKPPSTMSWSAVAKAAGRPPGTAATASAAPATSPQSSAPLSLTTTSTPTTFSASSHSALSPQHSHLASHPTTSPSAVSTSSALPPAAAAAGHHPGPGASPSSTHPPLSSAASPFRAHQQGSAPKPSALQSTQQLHRGAASGKAASPPSGSPRGPSPPSTSSFGPASPSLSSFSSTAPLQSALVTTAANSSSPSTSVPTAPSTSTAHPAAPSTQPSSTPAPASSSHNGEGSTAVKPLSAWAKPLQVAGKQQTPPPSTLNVSASSSFPSTLLPAHSTVSPTTPQSNGPTKRPSFGSSSRGGYGSVPARSAVVSSVSTAAPTSSPQPAPALSPSLYSSPLSSLSLPSLAAASSSATSNGSSSHAIPHTLTAGAAQSSTVTPSAPPIAVSSATAAHQTFSSSSSSSPSITASPPVSSTSPATASRGMSYSTIVAKAQPSSAAAAATATAINAAPPSPSAPPAVAGLLASHRAPIPSHPVSNGPTSVLHPSTPSPSPPVPSTPPPSAAPSASPALSPTSTTELSSPSPTASSTASPSSSSTTAGQTPSTGSAGKKKSKKKSKNKAAAAAAAAVQQQLQTAGGVEGKEPPFTDEGAGDSAAVTPLSHSPGPAHSTAYSGLSSSDDATDLPPPPYSSQPRMSPGADHAAKLQEQFPIQHTAEGYVILPPDLQAQQQSTQPQPSQQQSPSQPNDLTGLAHQQSPRRLFAGNKGGRQSAGGSIPSHQQPHQQSPNLPYRTTPPRRGLPFPPHSPQRQSPSYRGRHLNQQPRHLQQGYPYYPGAPFQPYSAVDQQSLDGPGAMGEEEGASSPLQVGMGMPYPPMQIVQMPFQPVMSMMQALPIVGGAASPLINSAIPVPGALNSLNPALLLQQPQPLPAQHPTGPGQPPHNISAAPGRRDGIRKQLEYYFSETNLARDVYLRSQMSPRGYVSLQKLLSFNKLRQLTGGDVDELVQAALLSPVLKVKAQAVKLRKGWSLWIPPPTEGEERMEDSSEEETEAFDGQSVGLDDVNGVVGQSEEHKQQQQQQAAALDPSLNPPAPPAGMVSGGSGYYGHPGMPPHPAMYYNFPAGAYGYPYYPPYYTAQLNPVLMQQQHYQQYQHQQMMEAQAQYQQQQQQHQQLAAAQQGGMGPGGGMGDGQVRRQQPRQSFHHRGGGGRGGGGGGGRGGQHQQGPRRGGQSTGGFSAAPSPQSVRQEGGASGPGGPPTPTNDA